MVAGIKLNFFLLKMKKNQTTQLLKDENSGDVPVPKYFRESSMAHKNIDDSIYYFEHLNDNKLLELSLILNIGRESNPCRYIILCM